MCTSVTYHHTIYPYQRFKYDLTHVLLRAYLVLEHYLFVRQRAKHCIVPWEAGGKSESQGVHFLLSANLKHLVLSLN